MKKGKVIGLVVLVLFLGGLGFGISQMVQNPEKYQSGVNVDVVFDASEYAYISTDSLIEKLGEPNDIYEYSKEDSYVYEDGMINFTIRNDTVTKFKYMPVEPISYKNQNDIFYMFGITPNKNTIKKTVDTNSTYKFQSVADGIWEFEIHGMNEKEKTFDMVFISYQQ